MLGEREGRLARKKWKGEEGTYKIKFGLDLLEED